MGWSHQSDNYCERTDLAFWSEPFNAVTNAAFLIAAVVMWRRSGGVLPAQVLCVILFAIGVGSFLFHTFATRWAALADVAPIGVFILTYLYLVHRYFVGWGRGLSIFATALFLPYAAAAVPVFNALPFLHISNFYWTVPLLLFLYAAQLYRRMPETARGMIGGGVLLCVSISLRSVDEIWCHVLPLGTHTGWHILNALMLGWMIEVFRRHYADPSRA